MIERETNINFGKFVDFNRDIFDVNMYFYILFDYEKDIFIPLKEVNLFCTLLTESNFSSC